MALYKMDDYNHLDASVHKTLSLIDRPQYVISDAKLKDILTLSYKEGFDKGQKSAIRLQAQRAKLDEVSKKEY